MKAKYYLARLLCDRLQFSEDYHTRTYQDDSGRLGYCVHTRIKKNYESGRSYIHYRIDNKVYKTKEKFVEALADFSFNKIPMYPKAMK